MIFDDSLKFSDAQSLVGAAPRNVVSTNVVDLSTAVRDPAAGTPIYLHFNFDTTVVGGVDTTLAASVVLDIDPSLVVLPYVLTSYTFNFAMLVAGQRFVLPMPLQPTIFTALGSAYRYLGVIYAIGGATAITAGTISCRGTLDPAASRYITADALN